MSKFILVALTEYEAEIFGLFGQIQSRNDDLKPEVRKAFRGGATKIDEAVSCFEIRQTCSYSGIATWEMGRPAKQPDDEPQLSDAENGVRLGAIRAACTPLRDRADRIGDAVQQLVQGTRHLDGEAGHHLLIALASLRSGEHALGGLLDYAERRQVALESGLRSRTER